jgi:hypothetical protein
MTELPPTEPNLDMLREMTGVPDLSEPLVAEDAFAQLEVRSNRPLWKMPLPKLLLIGTALVPVFALAGFFLAGSREAQMAGGSPASPPDSAPANKASGDAEAELQKAREEIAALKAKMALEDQGTLSQTAPPARPAQPQPTSARTPAPAVAAQPVPSSPPRVAPVSSPPTISYRPPPPQIQTAPQTAPQPVPPLYSSSRSGPVDPLERWQQLAQVGSYGSLTVTGEDVSPAPTAQPTLGQSLPTARLAPTSAVTGSLARHSGTISEPAVLAEAPAFSQRGAPAPLELEEPTPSQEPAVASESVSPPNVLAQAEARILQQPSSPQALIAGANSAGQLATPVILDSASEADRFLVLLSEPLIDSRGQVAIPAGSEILVKVDAVTDNGLVQLSAVQAVWEEQGLKRELILPDGVMLVRGNEGAPLIAAHYDDRGGEIAAMDAGQFALGALRRASELYTRPNTRVETGSGTTVVTQENPAPNVLAGILEGGTDAILDTIAERNQRAVEAIEQRPKIAYIEAGRPVQVFVNQSMQMPI